MYDVLIGNIIIKDGLVMFDNDIDLWILKRSLDEKKAEYKKKLGMTNTAESRVCFDCEYST